MKTSMATTSIMASTSNSHQAMLIRISLPANPPAARTGASPEACLEPGGSGAFPFAESTLLAPDDRPDGSERILRTGVVLRSPFIPDGRHLLRRLGENLRSGLGDHHAPVGKLPRQISLLSLHSRRYL